MKRGFLLQQKYALKASKNDKNNAPTDIKNSIYFSKL